MKLLKILLIIVLLLMVVTSVSANKILFAFVSGNEYIKYSVQSKIDYVEGLMDMTATLTQYYDPEEYLKILEVTEKMTCGQIVKIFNKYLEENPEELHYAAAVCFLNAIYEIVHKN